MTLLKEDPAFEPGVDCVSDPVSSPGLVLFRGTVGKTVGVTVGRTTVSDGVAARVGEGLGERVCIQMGSIPFLHAQSRQNRFICFGAASGLTGVANVGIKKYPSIRKRMGKSGTARIKRSNDGIENWQDEERAGIRWGANATQV